MTKKYCTITMTVEERQLFLKVCNRMLHFLNNAPVVESKPEYNSKSSPERQEPEAQKVTARIWKAEDSTTLKGSPCVRVTWGKTPAHPGETGGGIHTATCFDTAYFPAIRNAVETGQPLTFFVKRRGDYLNVVGVAA